MSKNRVCQNAVHWKYLGGALKTIYNFRVDRWTLSTLNGRHLVYIAEGAEISNGKMEDIVTFEIDVLYKCK